MVQQAAGGGGTKVLQGVRVEHEEAGCISEEVEGGEGSTAD